MSFDVPAAVTMHEPLVLQVSIENELSQQVSIDLGKNSVGHFQFSHEMPGGVQVTADPRRPRQPDESYSPGIVEIAPRSRHREEVLLDEWLDFSVVGSHRLQVRFIGATKIGPEALPAVPRQVTVDINVLPRDEAALRKICEHLIDQISQTRVPDEAFLAARKLALINDPVAVNYLVRAIEVPKVVYLDLIPIRGLARIGNEGARQALMKLGDHPDRTTATAALNALDRVNTIPPRE